MHFGAVREFPNDHGKTIAMFYLGFVLIAMVKEQWFRLCDTKILIWDGDFWFEEHGPNNHPKIFKSLSEVTKFFDDGDILEELETKLRTATHYTEFAEIEFKVMPLKMDKKHMLNF